jgi:hypothetical protein
VPLAQFAMLLTLVLCEPALTNGGNLKALIATLFIAVLSSFTYASGPQCPHRQRVMKLNSEMGIEVLGSEVLVDSTFIGRYREFSFCFEKAQVYESILSETLPFLITLDRNGTILSAQIISRSKEQPSQGRKSLLDCVTERVLRINVSGALPGHYRVNINFGK